MAPGNRTIGLSTSLLACCSLLMSACASQETKPVVANPAGGDSANFWRTDKMTSSLEKDPPNSLKELGRKADVIAIGVVKSVEPGRDYPQSDGYTFKTALLTINVGKIRRGGAAKVEPGTIQLEVNSQPQYESPTVASSIPADSYVFFLSKWYDGPSGPVYRCTSPAVCVVGVKEGLTVTPLDPEARDRVKSDRNGAASLDSVFAEAASPAS